VQLDFNKNNRQSDLAFDRCASLKYGDFEISKLQARRILHKSKNNLKFPNRINLESIQIPHSTKEEGAQTDRLRTSQLINRIITSRNITHSKDLFHNYSHYTEDKNAMKGSVLKDSVLVPLSEMLSDMKGSMRPESQNENPFKTQGQYSLIEMHKPKILKKIIPITKNSKNLRVIKLMGKEAKAQTERKLSPDVIDFKKLREELNVLENELMIISPSLISFNPFAEVLSIPGVKFIT